MTESERIICKNYLNELDETHTCNEYKLLMSMLETGSCEVWIPCSERLPEERQSVLVYCHCRDNIFYNIFCAYLYKKQWWIFGGAYSNQIKEDVIAWRPLPDYPYKEE